MLALLADERGRLWAGTGVGGLARYDTQCDCFVVYRAGPGGLSNPAVTAIASDGRGGVWVGTAAGLDHVDAETGVVRNVALAPEVPGPVLSLLQDRDGALWAGTEQGLFRRSPASEHFVAVLLDVPDNSALNVTDLRRDSTGRLWIATRSHGAFVIEPGQGDAQVVHGRESAAGLEGETIHAVVETKPGEIWLGTAGGGIVVVEPGAGWRTRRIRHHVAVPTSLQDDDVQSMLRDRSGLIWVGTTMALNMSDPRQAGVSTLFGASTRDKPITSVQIPFVMVEPEGRVWLSNGEDGRRRHPRSRHGSHRRTALRPGAPGERPAARARAVHGAGAGRRYLHRYPARASPHRRQAPARGADRVCRAALADANVWAMCLDDGVLWMGGSDGLVGARRRQGRERRACCAMSRLSALRISASRRSCAAAAIRCGWERRRA